MKASFLGKTVIAAAALALAAPASARLYDLGDLVSPPSISSAATASTGRYIVRGNKAGRFIDTFKFQVSKDADVTLNRLSDGGLLGRHVNLNSVMFALRDSDNKLIARVRGGQIASFAGRLDDGAYKVRLVGKLQPGFTRGAYRFNANAIAAPVPEPEEWALMILGSGIMAYQVRRKQRKLAADEPALTALPA